jgi:hypothetical protein
MSLFQNFGLDIHIILIHSKPATGVSEKVNVKKSSVKKLIKQVTTSLVLVSEFAA